MEIELFRNSIVCSAELQFSMVENFKPFKVLYDI